MNSTSKQYAVITLFPDMFKSLDHGIPNKARKMNVFKTIYINPRHYADNAYGYVDDRPYGGGPGMVLSAPPISRCISAAKSKLGSQTKVIYFSPHGIPLAQNHIEQLAKEENIIFLCGRYEGIDQRLIDSEVDESYCLSSCIFSGGEIPAMACLDAIIRLQPNVLNNPKSAQEESFSSGILDHPHYTRPLFFKNMQVPSVLLSGNHGRIRSWCREQALKATEKYRPELLKQVSTNKIGRTHLKSSKQKDEMRSNEDV